ncbi:MAG: CinA family protein [Clostridia bacterium]|nr:CinA family protein [Clostridia bacterium]
MLKDYSSESVAFKLYGQLGDSLQKAEKKIEHMSNGQITLLAQESDGDYLAVIAVKPNTDPLLLDDVLKSFIKTFSAFIYANEDISLQELAVQLLKISGKKLCTAESFTGGAVANAIVSVPGASEVFFEGLVCYNTLSKQQRLGVLPQTVREYSVVSKQVAFEMVKGLLSLENCDVAVSTTGYASPTGDDKKPCGLCYIGVATENKAQVVKYNFKGSREQIINQGKKAALFALCKLLKG